MSIGLIVERQGEHDESITIENWQAIVSHSPDLQIRNEPYIAVNPVTGEKISIAVGEGDSEVLVEGQWLPFLRFRRGRLVTEYDEELEDSSNPVRMKISQIAQALGAVIRTDLDDMPLGW